MSKSPKLKDILLADDDHDDYDYFDSALRVLAIPYELRHAEDGEMLFELLKEAVPDLLFLDIDMPCKDGITCITEIRKNPLYNHMPVIMFTAHVHKEYINGTYENGANFYIVKSTSISSLADKLRKIFAVDWKSQLYYPAKHEYVLA